MCSLALYLQIQPICEKKERNLSQSHWFKGSTKYSRRRKKAALELLAQFYRSKADSMMCERLPALWKNSLPYEKPLCRVKQIAAVKTPYCEKLYVLIKLCRTSIS
jgi:hypothetical protein